MIGRCLTTLLAGAEQGELEVIVVCNGCRDDTRRSHVVHAPDAMVLELPAASKPAALNAGDRRATRFPRIYLDADVEVPVPLVRELVRPLAEQPPRTPRPLPRFVLRHRPRRCGHTWPWHTPSPTRAGSRRALASSPSPSVDAAASATSPT